MTTQLLILFPLAYFLTTWRYFYYFSSLFDSCHSSLNINNRELSRSMNSGRKRRVYSFTNWHIMLCCRATLVTALRLICTVQLLLITVACNLLKPRLQHELCRVNLSYNLYKFFLVVHNSYDQVVGLIYTC